MTELRDIEESIRYSCRKMPIYGEDLIKKIRNAFETEKKHQILYDGITKIITDQTNATQIENGDWFVVELINLLKKHNEIPMLETVE